MDEKKKAEVIQLFKDHSGEEKKGTANVVKVKGNNNIAAGGDINGNITITTKPPAVRPRFTPGPEHIAQPEAKKISDLVANLADKEVAGGMDMQRARMKWFRALKNRYDVTTYLAIPRHLGPDAIAWLQQQAAIKRTKIRRPDPNAWRKEHYKAIWARARELGLSKGDVYNVVRTWLGKQVTTLTKLNERALKDLYSIIMSTSR